MFIIMINLIYLSPNVAETHINLTMQLAISIRSHLSICHCYRSVAWHLPQLQCVLLLRGVDSRHIIIAVSGWILYPEDVGQTSQKIGGNSNWGTTSSSIIIDGLIKKLHSPQLQRNLARDFMQNIWHFILVLKCIIYIYTEIYAFIWNIKYCIINTCIYIHYVYICGKRYSIIYKYICMYNYVWYVWKIVPTANTEIVPLSKHLTVIF